MQDRPEPLALATISRNITQRKREERELLMLKDELGAELDAMRRLHELSARLLAKGELSALLTEVLASTMALQSADFGNVQLAGFGEQPSFGLGTAVPEPSAIFLCYAPAAGLLMKRRRR